MGEGPLERVRDDSLVARAAEEYVHAIMNGIDGAMDREDPLTASWRLSNAPEAERELLRTVLHRAWRRAWLSRGFSQEVAEAFASRLSSTVEASGARVILAAMLKAKQGPEGVFHS